jgi:protein-tyrosine phosphatase
MELVKLTNNGYITNIIENLYLGDIEASQNINTLKENNIKNIINLSNNNYTKFEEINYYDINIEDKCDVKISKYFDYCIDIINKSKKENKNILVHCLCGVSRSVSIIIAYLINSGYTLKDALLYVKQKREKQYTQPNIGFFKELMKYEREKHSNNSITLSEYVKYIKNNY